MTHLENVSTEDLHQVLAEVEGKDATQRVMAAINWKEEDDIRQKDIVHRYGYTQGWLSQWLTRLERLEEWSAQSMDTHSAYLLLSFARSEIPPF
jgi:DNA-binding MarR family transcriptional regulator